jgi:hypothetical protein
MLKPIINSKLGLRVEVKAKIKNGAAISSTALCSVSDLKIFKAII